MSGSVGEGKEENMVHNGSSIKSLDDLMDAAGRKGRYNYLILFFCAWGLFVNPMSAISYQFLGATPPYWCRIPELEEANWTDEQIISLSVPERELNKSRIESCTFIDRNYSELASFGYELALKQVNNLSTGQNISVKDCYTRDFNSSEPLTVVSMWDLVCERRALYSTTQAFVLLGRMIGSPLVGFLADTFGRRSVFLPAIPLYFLIGIVTIFSPNAYVYIFLKMLISVVTNTFSICGLVLALEFCSIEQRSWMGSLFAVPWAIGYMLLPWMAYFIREFYYLQAATASTVLTLLPVYWILPESPTWLVSKGRFDEAINIISKISKKNKKVLPPRREMKDLLQKFYKEKQTEHKSETNVCSRLFALMVQPEWRWRVLAMFFNWIVASMVYYGVSLNPPNLSSGKYMYVFLGGLLEVPAYFALWPISKYFGRRYGMAFLYALSSIAIFGAMGLTLTAGNEKEVEISSSVYGWLMFLALLGKFAITAALALIWFYTTELFPTHCRSLMVGAGSCSARIGSIPSPYIVDLLGALVNWLPSAIFATASLLAALMVFALPESRDIPMS